MEKILQKAANFKAMSDGYHAKFKETNDPSIIGEFYKKSFLAMKEAWVRNEIISWHLRQDFEALKVLNLSKGERKEQNRYIMAVKKLMIFDKVNDLVSKGSKKAKAFEAVAVNFLGEAVSPDTIRNMFYWAQKFEPEIKIEETTTEIITTCGPTRIWLNDFRAYGFFEYRKPKI
jgi:hypothetical protein